MTYAFVQLIMQLGVRTQLVKLDLQKVYRIVPTHPQDHHLLAIEWEGKTYVDRALPVGPQIVLSSGGHDCVGMSL